MTNISDSLSLEKTVTLIIEKTSNHVRIREKNFFLLRQHDLQESKSDLEVYEERNALRLRRYHDDPEPESIESSTRGCISGFSYKSQTNCNFKFDSASRDMSTTICLTYPLELREKLDGRLIKKHFKAFILAYLRKFGLSGRYIWVLEFQKNGNPHFHLVTDCKADIKAQREFVAARWYKIVGSGLEKALRAGTSCEVVRSRAGVAAYMASYLKKANQKQVPDNFANVGRFWGGSKHAFEVETTFRCYENSMEGVAAARRAVRSFRKYKSAKLRDISRKTGIRYKLPKPSGGFVCWSGRNAFDQLMMFYEGLEKVPF